MLTHSTSQVSRKMFGLSLAAVLPLLLLLGSVLPGALFTAVLAGVALVLLAGFNIVTIGAVGKVRRVRTLSAVVVVALVLPLLAASGAVGAPPPRAVEKSTRVGSMAEERSRSVSLLQPSCDATPVATLDVPSSGFIGESFSFTVTFDNTSTTDEGFGPFIDLILPRNGADGDAGTDTPDPLVMRRHPARTGAH